MILKSIAIEVGQQLGVSAYRLSYGADMPGDNTPLSIGLSPYTGIAEVVVEWRACVLTGNPHPN